MQMIKIKISYLCKRLVISLLPPRSTESFRVRRDVEIEAIRCEAKLSFRIIAPLTAMLCFETGREQNYTSVKQE